MKEVKIQQEVKTLEKTCACEKCPHLKRTCFFGDERAEVIGVSCKISNIYVKGWGEDSLLEELNESCILKKVKGV